MNKNYKKGISLIVLVITMIVMAILATVVILTLNSTNIIGNTSKVVDSSNLEQVQEVASVAWMSAFTKANIEQREDASYFRTEVINYLAASGVDVTKYILMVTTNGVTVETGWAYKADPSNGGRKTLITNGIVDLKIGSDIEYTATGTSYNGGWQVLGVEDGKLLILSSGLVITEHEINSEEGYVNTVADLDEVCSQFAGGTGAVFARSIRVEDINRITGYNPSNTGTYDPALTGVGVKYGEGRANEYGNIVSYYWDGTEQPHYVGTNGVSGNLRDSHIDGFSWYNSSINNFVLVPYTTTVGIITTLAGNYYEYYPVTLTESNGANNVGISTLSNEYQMIFKGKTSNFITYWLASPCINAVASGARAAFYVRLVDDGYVSAYDIVDSSVIYDMPVHPVRAVVALSKDINVTGSNEDGWSF